MINITEVTNPDLIRTTICEPMHKFPRVEMDMDLVELFIRISMLSPKKPAIPESEIPFLFKVIEKRMPACYTFKCDDYRVIIFLSALAETPGIAILYLWYIQYWCHVNNVEKIDWLIFGTRIFPNGFFDEIYLHGLWKLQKVDDGKGERNLVDFASAGQSIQFERKTV